MEGRNARQKAKEEASDEAKALKASQDKEREEKQKQEKARQAKEKEDKEKMEKAKKDKEKEAKEGSRGNFVCSSQLQFPVTASLMLLYSGAS